MFFPEMRRLLQENDFLQNNLTFATLNGTLLEDTLLTSVTDAPEDAVNATGIVLVEDEGLVETEFAPVGYSDVQTVFIACIATLLLLVVILVAVLCIRLGWQKLRERQDEGYRGVMHGDESLDPLAGKSSSTSGHQLPDELKISESQFSIAPAAGEPDESAARGVVMDYANLSSSVQNHTSKTANGSIITMTLKNNHLIVETEERGSPPTENTVSTTKFSTSSSPGRNNVFVVEVQHTTVEPSVSSYPGVTSALSSQEEIYDIDEDIEDDSRHSTSQQVQVHQPPNETSEPPLAQPEPEPELEPEPQPATPNTGLSQSDLSISSAGSNNPSYRYGNQLAYDGGHYGYPQYTGYATEEISTFKSSHSSNSMSMPLLDDDEGHQSEQMKLGNGDGDCEVRGLPQGEIKVVKALVEDVRGRRGPMIKSGFFQSKSAEKSAFNKIVRETLDEIEKDGDRKSGVTS